MKREKWITKDYIVAWLASFLISINFYLLMVSTSGYAMGAFGASSALAGATTSIYVFAAIITRAITGRIIFRAGCIRCLIIGFVSSLIISLCYFFANSIGTLIAIRILHGLSLGVASTTIFTIASVLIPKNRTGMGMGFFSISTTLGTAIGPFLAVYAVGMLLTGLASKGIILLIAAFLGGTGMGAIQSATLSIGVKYASPERLGMVNSTYYIFLDLGLTIGPIVGGLLVPFIGYSGTYMLGMPISLFGILLYFY